MDFIKSTPERRAGVLQLKLMVDEAHRLREEDNIWGYAHKIADIDLALAKLDPYYSDKLPQKEKSAAITRSMGQAPDNSDPNWREDNFTYLDKQLQSTAKLIVIFEDELRQGFRVQFTLPPGLAKFI